MKFKFSLLHFSFTPENFHLLLTWKEGRTHLPQHMSGGQRSTLQSQSFPSTMWVTWSSKCPYPLSHLPSWSYSFLHRKELGQSGEERKLEHPLSSPIKELTGQGLFQTEPVFGPGSHPGGCLLAERPRELFWNRIAGCEGLSVCPESSGTCLILLGLMVDFLE